MKSSDDYENEIAELQLLVEDMERTHSIVIGAFIGLLAHSFWHSWVATLLLGCGGAFIYWKYWAKKPFVEGIDKSTDSK